LALRVWSRYRRPRSTRELDVLDVAGVLLERLAGRQQRGVDLGETLVQRVEVERLDLAGHDVLALAARQELAVGLALAGVRVAGEEHAGPGRLVEVAEHHRLDGHGGAAVLRDVPVPAVGLRARRPPRAEHREDRAAQLLVRVVRHGLALELLHLGAQLGRALVGARLDPRAQDGLGVGLDEAPVRVGGERRVAGLAKPSMALTFGCRRRPLTKYHSAA
jgi:hypothetical protein